MRISVPDRLSRPHPLVEQTRKVLDAKEGRASRHGDLCLDVRVWPESLPRAYRILDALIKALEERQYPVAVRPPNDRQTLAITVVRILDQHITFHIEERGRQIRTKRTYGTGPSAWSRDELGLAPTGELALKIDSWAPDLRQSWRDGARQRLEAVLNDVIVGMVTVAEHHLEWQRRREAEAAARAAEQRRREELERLRLAEEARIGHLRELVRRWRFCRDARMLMDVLKARGTVAASASTEDAFGRWAAWAGQYIERIDPATEGGFRAVLALVASAEGHEGD